MGIALDAGKGISKINPVAAAGVQAAGSIGSGLLTLIGNKRRSERALKQNKELMQYQYDQNLEQWKAENEYNSPAAQMQRLKEAGLNPNLVYGDGNAIQRSAGSPNMGAPTVKPDQAPNLMLPDVIGTYMSLKRSQDESRMLQAQIENMNIKNDNDAIQTGILNYIAQEKGINMKEIIRRDELGHFQELNDLKLKAAKERNRKDLQSAAADKLYYSDDRKNRSEILKKKATESGDPMVDFISNILENTDWGKYLIEQGKGLIQYND